MDSVTIKNIIGVVSRGRLQMMARLLGMNYSYIDWNRENYGKEPLAGDYFAAGASGRRRYSLVLRLRTNRIRIYQGGCTAFALIRTSVQHILGIMEYSFRVRPLLIALVFSFAIMAQAAVALQQPAALPQGCSGAKAHFWYQDNNFVDPSLRFPKDFEERYDPEKMEIWQGARASMGAYMLPPIRLFADVTDDIFTDAFLRDRFLPALAQSGTKLAFNVTGTKLGPRPRIQANEIEAMRRIQRLGGTIDFVTFQSALSKGSRRKLYPIDKAIQDVVAYAEKIHKEFPNARLGLVDALPSHQQDYTGPYRALKEALAQKGLTLDHIIVDISVDLWYRRDKRGVSIADVKKVGQYIRDKIGVRFGLILTSRKGGSISPEDFRDRVLRGYQDFLASGGKADFYLVTSWFKFPDYSIPGADEDTPSLLEDFTTLISTYCAHTGQ